MSSRSLKAKLVASPYIVWSAIFIIAPLIFVAYYAFTDANGRSGLFLRKFGSLEQLAQGNDIGLSVGDLNADGASSRDGSFNSYCGCS